MYQEIIIGFLKENTDKYFTSKSLSEALGIDYLKVMKSTKAFINIEYIDTIEKEEKKGRYNTRMYRYIGGSKDMKKLIQEAIQLRDDYNIPLDTIILCMILNEIKKVNIKLELGGTK